MLAAISVNVGVGRRASDHRAMQVMGVVMVVMINRQALGVLAKQLDEGRIATDLLRMPGTAHMAIEANHLVGGAHHQMQIVRYHQHAAAVAVPQTRDQAIQLGLTGHIDALHRLIQHQQFRLAQQRTGQQHTLHFAAGNALHRAVDHVFCADFLECGQGARTVHTRYQPQEAQHGQRQGWIDVEFLRHVTDPQFRLAPDAAAVRLQQPEYGAHQRGLAGAIGADQGDDLPRFDAQLDVIQHGLPGKRDGNVFEADQRIAHQAPWQPEQRPTTSTVWASTTKPTSLALKTIASLMDFCSSSMAAWHSRQIRNWPWCACSGWLQPTKALSEEMRCTRPLSSRKSSARYTVGGAARRPSCSLSTPRMS